MFLQNTTGTSLQPIRAWYDIKNWAYIWNAYPNRRLLCGESTRVFPAGDELWDAHAKHRTTPGQENIFMLPRPEEELYNVKKDPYQLHNLAEVKSNQETLNFLQKVLDAWILETGDSVPEQPRADREDVYGHIVSSA